MHLAKRMSSSNESNSFRVVESHSSKGAPNVGAGSDWVVWVINWTTAKKKHK
jgi:hypothetical protein